MYGLTYAARDIARQKLHTHAAVGMSMTTKLAQTQWLREQRLAAGWGV